MDDSAVKTIATLAGGASGARALYQNDAERVRSLNGQIIRLERIKFEQHLVLESLEDVRRICRSEVWADVPSVFVSRDSIGVTLNGDDRRRRATLELKHTDAFRFLYVLDQNDEPLTDSPGGLVRTLRFKLGDCGGPLEQLIAALRQVTFNSSAQRDTVANHGASSMGKRLSAKVDQIDKIPETLILSVAPFDVNGCDDVRSIRIGIHVDPIEETVSLAPIAGEIDNALRRTQGVIVDRLRDMFADDDVDSEVLVLGGDCSQ